MKFQEVIILDWYDYIITAFCKDEKNITYICNLLAIDHIKGDKIYVCIELKYFVQSDLILSIIKRNKCLEQEEVLQKALNMVTLNNESFLIKTDDLKSNSLIVIKYKNNFNWNHDFLSTDYPNSLEKSEQLDDWWKYFLEFN